MSKFIRYDWNLYELVDPKALSKEELLEIIDGVKTVPKEVTVRVEKEDYNKLDDYMRRPPFGWGVKLSNIKITPLNGAGCFRDSLPDWEKNKAYGYVCTCPKCTTMC